MIQLSFGGSEVRKPTKMYNTHLYIYPFVIRLKKVTAALFELSNVFLESIMGRWRGIDSQWCAAGTYTLSVLVKKRPYLV